MLTIAYFTNRLEPRIQWFFDSLHRETGGNYEGIRIVVVDFWAQEMPGWRDDQVRDRLTEIKGGLCRWLPENPDFYHVPPKPTVWQGPHRLTSQDYFAASNARNTAIALAPDGYIAFVDDLSVLLPGWLAAVRAAEAGKYIALGAYKKVKDLVVENGEVRAFTPFPGGVDSRWNKGGENPVPAGGSWLFGCSLAAPVQALLAINGFDEDCDSMGGEDYCAGIALEKAGQRFKYVQSMCTYESEEDHAQLPVFKRIIKKHRGANAKCPDASHWMLQEVMRGRRPANYFGGGGLAELRQRVLKGEPFPINHIPEHDWRDGQPLKEM